MYFNDHHQFHEAMHWLLNVCALEKGEGEADRFVHNILNEHLSKLIVPDNGAAQQIVKVAVELCGFHISEPHFTPNPHVLPQIVLIPQRGIGILYTQNAVGTWHYQSPSGEGIFNDFPNGSCFIDLVRERKVHYHINAYKMFRNIALKQRTIFANGALTSFLINIIALATSFYSMQIYDRVIPTQGISTLVALTVGVGLAMVFELLMKIVRTKIVDQAIKEMDVSYSHEIFSRLLNIRGDSFPRSIGTLSSQMQSSGAIRGFITSASLYLLVDIPFAFLFVFIVMMIGTPLLGAIAIGFFVLSVMVGILFRHKIEALSRESNAISHKKLGLLVETISGAETVKSSGAGWNLMNRWNTMSRMGVEDDIAIRHYSELSMYLSAFMQQAGYVSIVAVGAYAVSVDQTMSMGGLIACTILSGRMLSPVNMIPNLLVQWGKAKMAMDDIEKIYALEGDHHDVIKPLTPQIITNTYQFHNVKFRYGDQPILSLPTLTIRSGEKIAILGSIGAGKSTLLRLLAGFYKPTEGKVMIGGLDISHISRHRLTQEIGYLPQEAKLFSGTLRDNLTFGINGISDEDILKACNTTGLIAYVNTHPKGLDAPITEGGNVVSGGQRQLIALTRVIIATPSVWLLDEPTANLDDRSEQILIHQLRDTIKSDETMIVVTHKPQILSLVSRIIILGNEGIVMDGPKEEILRKISATPKR